MLYHSGQAFGVNRPAIPVTIIWLFNHRVLDPAVKRNKQLSHALSASINTPHLDSAIRTTVVKDL